MRVALFTDTYDEINGVGNTYRHLTADCSRRGRQLDVYAYATDRTGVEDMGSVKIHRFKPKLPLAVYTDLIFDLAVLHEDVHSAFCRHSYDLIHTATPGSIGLMALWLARHFELPMIGVYHTSLGDYVRRRVEKLLGKMRLPSDRLAGIFEDTTWGFMRWYYDHCRMVLAPSRYTRQLLEQRFNVPVDIFGRGIDTERFRPDRGTQRNGVTVLYVGRVSIEKNLDTLAEIFRDKKDARLVVVGDGPYLKEMKERVPEADFRGFVGGDALAEAYASADLFAFPSTTDTFGNVVREAMSSGLPVVVTDKMGPKEQVEEGRTGFITTDRRDFAAKLQRLIDDAELRKQMGENARAYALTKSWGTVFDRLFEQYREAIGS